LGGSKDARGREKTAAVVDTELVSCVTTELANGVDDSVQVGDMGQSGEIKAELAQKLLSSLGLGRQIRLEVSVFESL